VLTCEENYQDQVRDEVDAQGRLIEDAPLPFGWFGAQSGVDEPQEFRALGQGLEVPLDGRSFGWVCEVDPAGGALRKLPRLGRFRHENAGVSCERGQPLVVYQGDDRRGGHVWKYVSRGEVRDPADRENSALLDDGVLLFARFEPDGSGQWVPLEPATPLARPRPEHTAGGYLWVPARGDVSSRGRALVSAPGAEREGLSVDRWVARIERACGRSFDQLTLGDLVELPEDAPPLAEAELERHRQHVLLLEAFAMANAAGATPTARPEDVEIHPHDGSLYVAFTDATGSTDGTPDRRVFPDSTGTSSRQYGGVLRLEEAEGPAGRTFRWSRFLSSGELWEGGGAFACADNLVFDPQGNLWITCDVPTDSHNAQVDREAPGSRPGERSFPGVFGNNALFMVPTAGPRAGVPVCFAIGPMECELTGPTFTADGRTLILSVQHPGETWGTRGREGSGLPGSVERSLSIADREGRPFTQRRSVPLGSNFPDGRPGVAPSPCVVCITRTP
jgi:secreted PhoX family phosphatase